MNTPTTYEKIAGLVERMHAKERVTTGIDYRVDVRLVAEMIREEGKREASNQSPPV